MGGMSTWLLVTRTLDIVTMSTRPLGRNHDRTISQTFRQSDFSHRDFYFGHGDFYSGHEDLNLVKKTLFSG